MDDEEKRGLQVFDSMGEDDKRALKRFLTGQIQNILANQYGIGGVKTLRNEVDGALALQLDSPAFIEKVGQKLVGNYRIGAKDALEKALTLASNKAVAGIVAEAAAKIKVQFLIPEPQPEGITSENFGKF